MHMPNYDGLVDAWKVDLIIARAKRMGFREHEIPDVLQEIVLALLAFRYDPHHASAAQERTVLTTVVDGCLTKMKRTADRYQAHVAAAASDMTIFSREEVSPVVIDVAMAVARLSPRERVICNALAAGLTKQQIAKRLGCGWHRVDRVMQAIRMHFEQLGLEGWIGE